MQTVIDAFSTDHVRGVAYTKDELRSNKYAAALAARCTKEYQDPDVLARIRATTGLNSPIWFGNYPNGTMGALALWVPALLVLGLLGAVGPMLADLTRAQWQTLTGWGVAVTLTASVAVAARLLYHIATHRP